MNPAKRSRADWIRVGFTAFGEVGVDNVRVDRIAETLGVTKGSFYWHFRDRGSFLQAVVDDWETRGTDDIITSVDGSGLDPEGRARLLWDRAASGGMACELAIRDWARRDQAVATSVQRVDGRRLVYLEALLADLGSPTSEIKARALLLYSLLIGDHLISTTQPAASRRRATTEALVLLTQSAAR